VHVLIAATPGLETEVDRALDWAAPAGATRVDRVRSDGGTVALASSGGSMARVTRKPDATVVSLGVHAVGDVAALLDGRIPGGTVAAAMTGGRVLVGAGAGNQRLFRATTDRGTLVSSHVGALVAALGAGAALDRSYEDFLLGFGFLPDGRTPFAGIRAMARPAVEELDGGASLPVVPPPATAADASTPPDLAELVCEIVDEQAGAMRRVGVLLGGFDSALVAAALHRTGREVHTFTFDFAEPGYVQRNVDAAVAAAGATHHWVRFTPEIMGDALRSLPDRLNQPGPQPHYQIQTIVAGEHARDAGVEAIFTGDGCDALFASYPTVNTRAAATGGLQRVPAAVRRSGIGVLSVEPVDRRLGHVARVGRSALRASLLDGPASRHLPTQYLDEVALDRLRGDAPPQAEPVEGIRRRLADDCAETEPGRLAHDGNARTGQSQSKVEGLVARTGLGVYSPFTDPRFRAAIAALPTHLRRPSGGLLGAEGKPVLPDAVERSGLLPPAVIHQRKQAPTEAPVDLWYAGPLRSTVYELLADLPFEVNTEYVEQVLRPKRAEDLYRRRVALSRHVLQAVGLLASYGAFARLVR